MLQLYNNTAKYANIAGIAESKFKDLLNTNPGEAFLEVAKGLKGTGQLATEFAEGLKELGSNGVRVQQTIGAMASDTEYFSQKIKLLMQLE